MRPFKGLKYRASLRQWFLAFLICFLLLLPILEGREIEFQRRAGGVHSRLQIRGEGLGSTLARYTDELEQLPIPFGVDPRMEVVHRPGGHLYPRFDRGCI